DLRQAAGADDLRNILRNALAALDDDFAGSLALGWVDDVVHRHLAFDLPDAAAVDHLLPRDRVEASQNVSVQSKIRPHRSQQRHPAKLAALVDADGDAVLFRRVELDPASTLGDDAARIHSPLARVHFRNEIDAGRTMKLRHDDAFGAIDDEFAAA